MYFTAKQLVAASSQHSIAGQRLSLSSAKSIIKETKTAILSRNYAMPFKWYRPWDVVPALKNFVPPEGDVGVGIEIEAGIRTEAAYCAMAKEVWKMRNVAIDREGSGSHGTEVTFPPMLLSKMTKDSRPFKYQRLLASLNNNVVFSDRDGTHINISLPQFAARVLRAQEHTPNLFVYVRQILQALAPVEQAKYFGRRPYGYCYNRGKYIEWKLFQSTTSIKQLQQYVRVAVALTAWMLDSWPADITLTKARTVLESAYNAKGFGIN